MVDRKESLMRVFLLLLTCGSLVALEAFAGPSYDANGQPILTSKQLFWSCVKTASAGYAHGGHVDFTRDPAIMSACKYVNTYDKFMCVRYLRIDNPGQRLTAFTRGLGHLREALDPRRVAGCGGA
jgi:hypothetical protein